MEILHQVDPSSVSFRDIHCGRQERYAGSCSRSFYVGGVKPEEIHAKYESGILTVLVPKEDIKKSPVGIAITIE